MESAKILRSYEEVLAWAEEVRCQDKKVIFANGCFDILHAGHVLFLRSMRAKLGPGFQLLVALNSDDSIARLKGKDRPINRLSRRAAVVAGLRYVDAVTMFESDTPNQLIKGVKPEILAKGGDYSEEQVVGRELVKEYGGKIYCGSYIEGLSTSRIVGILNLPN